MFSKIYNTSIYIYIVYYIITLEQIPHPMHSSSEMKAILSAGVTSMHNFPKEEHENTVFIFHIHNCS